jgi:hypothetical protein
VPRRNRVTPFGDIIATPARGLVYGNRGVLHDPDGRLVRTWQVRRWLACRLEFRGRHREQMRPGHYTELYFLDEATALAAGHRPCSECRHVDYLRFRQAWMDTHAGRAVRADDMDRILHEERIDRAGAKLTHQARLGDLPDGAMISADDRAWLVHGDELMAWSASGYTDRRTRSGSETVALLTPPSTVAVMRAGFPAAVHLSAADT